MRKVFVKFGAFVAFLFVLGFSSCQLDNGTGYRVNASSLRLFGHNIMDMYMFKSMMVMNMMLEVDEYLRLPEEEQKKSDLNKIIHQIDENNLEVENFGYISFGGTSVCESGAEWVLSNSYILPEMSFIRYSVKCIDQNKWAIYTECSSDNVSAESLIELQLDRKSQNEVVYVISMSGKHVEKERLASFSTTQVPFVLQYVGANGLDLTGVFNVDIFRSNSLIDYCHIEYGGNDEYLFRTSRD